jgi:hypothetical protein
MEWKGQELGMQWERTRQEVRDRMTKRRQGVWCYVVTSGVEGRGVGIA